MKNRFLLLLCLSLAAIACNDYLDVNTDPNKPVQVQEALILSAVEYKIGHEIQGGGGFLSINHYMQNVSLNQPIPNEGTYLLLNENVNGAWNVVYVDCLNNLRLLQQQAENKGNTNYAAIARILTAFCLGQATDLWGDIPYSQALQGNSNFTPAYDRQEDIYKTIQLLLDAGLADIAKAHPTKPAGDDYFYKGNMDNWKRLAYTLKARYYMHLSKAPGYNAVTQANLALEALKNGMTSHADDMKLVYPGSAGNENHWFRHMLPVSTLVASAELVDSLKTRNDPRLSKLIYPAEKTGLYTGRPIGLNDLGELTSYSKLGSFYASASAPVYLVNYSEALFLKAEATLYTAGVAAAAPIHKEAILSHMTKLGLSATDPAVSTYLATRGVLTETNALRLLMEEKSIANFLSLENFTDWRRTGFPALKKAPNALSAIPRRLLYPLNEITSNPQPLHGAKLTDRVWWDQ